MECTWRQGLAPMNPMLLQHTLRELCSNESQWVYAVFWRILPRNYPPPQWDTEGGIMDRSKGNRRNWILVWEDGFCNFSACGGTGTTSSDNSRGSSNSFLSVRQQQQQQQQQQPPPQVDVEEPELTMNPELFFKMSHEIYNYGEGLMGKVAVDNSHKWVCREPLENEIGFFTSPWHNSIDPHPRTWEGQFKSGIQTIAVVAVPEGVLQLGSTQKIMEDMNFVLYMQRKFNFLHSIPGQFVPHPELGLQPPRKRGNNNNNNPLDNSLPNAAGYRSKGSMDQTFLSPRLASPPVAGMKRPPEPLSLNTSLNAYQPLNAFEQCRPEHCLSPPKALHSGLHGSPQGATSPTAMNMPTLLAPSMSSLQALLSKLPSVTVPLDNNGGLPSYGRFDAPGVGNACLPTSHASALQRMVDGEAMAATCSADAGEDQRHSFNFVTAKEKPRHNNHNNNNNNCNPNPNSVFDSFHNFTEFGIQEALENGDSSYTSFLNEICS